MILKHLRLSRALSQEQLASMSGLSVRTIQRIESGHKASLESQKCLAAALNVDLETLNQEVLAMDKSSDQWKQLPLFIRLWFIINFLQLRPDRVVAVRVENIANFAGFIFCVLGWVNEAALAGGLILLASSYFTKLLRWQGDCYGIWYESE